MQEIDSASPYFCLQGNTENVPLLYFSLTRKTGSPSSHPLHKAHAYLLKNSL